MLELLYMILELICIMFVSLYVIFKPICIILEFLGIGIVLEMAEILQAIGIKRVGKVSNLERLARADYRDNVKADGAVDMVLPDIPISDVD